MSRLLPVARAMPLTAVLAAAVFLGFGVPAASAVVHVDPNGPAGQQYELPLDSVRGEVSGNPAAGVPGATSQAPLFGEGIRPENKKVQSPDGGSGNGGGDEGGSANGGAGSGADKKSVEINPTIKELINGTGGGTSTTLEMLLMIGGIALVGLTAGLIGRRTL